MTMDHPREPGHEISMRWALRGANFADLDVEETETGVAFASSGPDPRMHLCDAAGDAPLVLQPGRYHFIVRAAICRGRMRRPRLYLDFGDGFSECANSNVFLNRASEEVWYGAFEATRSVLSVRFDPSDAPVRFLLRSMEIERWHAAPLTTAQLAYHGLRALYLKMPRGLRESVTFNRIAEATAERVFRRQRDAHRAASIDQFSLAPRMVGQLEQTQRSQRMPTRNRFLDAYIDALDRAQGAYDPCYAPLRKQPVAYRLHEPRMIAFYLPQFHSIPENDAWWGRGFTEWTNVAKAVPQFVGHNQPRLPGELGYYDLRSRQTMVRQFELARLYGLDGFCFHYYWFAGKRLLESPIEALLADASHALNFPFCLCWANENWTRRWDGLSEEILIEQHHTTEDHLAVFADLARYMRDPRYIRVEGKPLLIVYRPGKIPDVEDMAQIWRDRAPAEGLPGVYIVGADAFGFKCAPAIGFDAVVQFPPHGVPLVDCSNDIEWLNLHFAGKVYDYSETADAFVDALEDRKDDDVPYFAGVMAEWDNEARLPGRGYIFHNPSPAKFYDWLRHALDWTHNRRCQQEQLIFINAWNEWAEGACLEPDRRKGYAYLSAIAAARLERRAPDDALSYLAANHLRVKQSDSVVVVHLSCDYDADRVAIGARKFRDTFAYDLILTAPDTLSTEVLRRTIAGLDPVRIILTKDRGRDVWPFVEAARIADGMGYLFGCKFDPLNDSEEMTVRDALLRDRSIGFAAPQRAFLKEGELQAIDLEHVLALLRKLGLNARAPQDFVAGASIWFRLAALRRLLASDVSADDFGPDLGAVVGTFANALEFALPTIAVCSGYAISRVEDRLHDVRGTHIFTDVQSTLTK